MIIITKRFILFLKPKQEFALDNRDEKVTILIARVSFGTVQQEARCASEEERIS